MITITGRMRGFTENLDMIERVLQRHIKRDKLSMTFTVTDRKIVGTYGWINKRFISSYEYTAEVVNREQAQALNRVILSMLE